jgi:glutathione S-transferase
LAQSLTRPEHHWEDAKVLATIETMTGSVVNANLLKLVDGLEADQVKYSRRQYRRAGICLDWLNDRATPEGFAPGQFSIMDTNLICAIGYVERYQLMQWRDRCHLAALVDRYQHRPSVEGTAATSPPAPSLQA